MFIWTIAYSVISFQIHSDFDNGKGNIFYSLEGIGANQSPFHIFVVDPRSGLIRVTKLLDREQIDTYNVSDRFDSVLLYFLILFFPLYTIQ